MVKYKKKPKNQPTQTKLFEKPPKNLQDVVLLISAGRADLKILVTQESQKYLVHESGNINTTYPVV